MDNSVYVALSKQVGMQRQLDVIANNIANANTTGFKAEEMLFEEYLVEDAKNRDTAYAYDVATIRNTEQGSMEPTGNQLDVAIQGKGFFGVQTDLGERYTRAGNFLIDTDGVLVTQDGDPVLNDAGAEIQFEEDDVQVMIFGDGRVEVDGEERDAIGIFQFENEQLLQPLQAGLYASTEPAIPNEGEGVMMQGFLEKSNVQPIVQMTNLMKLQRAYEGSAKFISGLYDMQEDAIRRIARQS